MPQAISESSTETAALRFVQEPYHENDLGNLLLHFREQGYAILRSVFERDSVDAYREQICARVEPTDTPWNPLQLRMDDALVLEPARAPRLQAVLRAAFMPWATQPRPVLRHPAWLIKPTHPKPEVVVNDWHKDADHLGTTTRQGYVCPQEISTAIYLEDMTLEHGPTYAIPRSHRDPTLSPYSGAHEIPFLPGKADVVIWDQRLWHRASARTVPGLRTVAIFNFFAVPYMHGPNPTEPARLKALAAAQTPEERLLFGDLFSTHTCES